MLDAARLREVRWIDGHHVDVRHDGHQSVVREHNGDADKRNRVQTRHETKRTAVRLQDLSDSCGTLWDIATLCGLFPAPSVITTLADEDDGLWIGPFTLGGSLGCFLGSLSETGRNQRGHSVLGQ